jgi:predicted transcriptional regulator
MKKAPSMRRSELEMGIDILKVLPKGRAGGKTTRLLLEESGVNHKVFKRMESQMITSGLLIRKKRGNSILYRTSDFGSRILREYRDIRGYFIKNQK